MAAMGNFGTTVSAAVDGEVAMVILHGIDVIERHVYLPDDSGGRIEGGSIATGGVGERQSKRRWNGGYR
jgi:hypothetical protein